VTPPERRTRMEALNIPLMQVQYEVLHDSIDKIADEHDVSRKMVEYAVKQHGWERKDLSASEQGDALEVANTDRQMALEAVHTLRQGVLDPQYIKIEASLVNKAIEIINSIQAAEPTASRRLKEITDILSTLRPTKAMQKQTEQAGGLKLMVMTHVGDVNAVQSKKEQVEVVVESS
jgi:hypothetical protein